MKKSVIFGALAIVGAALLWSIDNTFLRPHLFSLSPTFIVFLEHFFGFVLLLPFTFKYRKQILLLGKKHWLSLLWVALFGGVLGTTFFTKALFATNFQDISVVVILQKLQPIFAILLSTLFLRERFPRLFYLYGGIAIIAGYFTTFADPFAISNVSHAKWIVILYALLAAFSWGSSTVFGKYSVKNIHPFLMAALRFGLTFLILTIPFILNIKSFNEFSIQHAEYLGAIVVFTAFLSMSLYYFGLKRIPASLATLCELSWPVSAIFFDYFFNGNILSWSQIIATVILVFAVYKVVKMQKIKI